MTSEYSTNSEESLLNSSVYNSALDNSDSEFGTLTPSNISNKTIPSSNDSSFRLIMEEQDNAAAAMRQPNEILQSPRSSISRKDDSTFDDIVVISSDDESTLYCEFSGTSEPSDTSKYTSVSTDSTSSSNTLTKSDENDINRLNTSTSIVADAAETSDNIPIYQSLEEFDKNLPHTVCKLETPFNSQVYLVGTAHFSEESQNDVSMVIRNVKPDVIMVELCPSRVHMLRYDEKTLLEEAKNMNISTIRSVIKSNGLINGIFYILLLNMSAKLTKEFGAAPGGEFRRALEEANKIQKGVIHLGDRPIQITLQRALSGLSYWQTIKIVWKLLTTDEKFTVDEIERCKEKDLLEEILQDMTVEYPAFREVFVTERDLYLCNSLQIAAKPRVLPINKPPIDGEPQPVKVVAIVGIGHSAGIIKHWGKVDPKVIPEILKIPPPSLSSRVIRFTFKYGMLTLIGYGVYKLISPKISKLI